MEASWCLIFIHTGILLHFKDFKFKALIKLTHKLTIGEVQLKSNLIFGFFLITLVGCHQESKKHSSSNLQQNSNEITKTMAELSRPKNTTEIDENFKLNQTYQGDNLLLIYPHARNFGWWKLKGEDAKVLYESLEIEPIKSEGGTVYLPSSIKNASSVSCYKQSFRSDPKTIFYSCSFFINYRSGNVVKAAHTINEIGRSAPSETELKDYQGNHLVINTQDESATVSVSGNDAKALYYSMDLFEGGKQEGFGLYHRKANMIDCRIGMNSDVNACYIRINAKTGELEFPIE